MNIQQFVASLQSEPQFIAPHRVAPLLQAIGGAKSSICDDIEDDIEEQSKRPQMEIVGRVAVIPLRGVMTPSTDTIMRYYGCVGADDIQQMIYEAGQRPDVGAVVLSVDSPGGSTMQTPETAAAIRELRNKKPVIAHTSGLMCSAAYYASAGASAIYADASAIVGSIGTYMALLDSSKLYDEYGYKVELIKSQETPLKAAGLPGTSLTPEQRSDLQGIVDHMQSKFAGWVSGNRPQAKKEAMRGQWMTGDKAKEMGLVDSIASLSQAISDAQKIAI